MRHYIQTISIVLLFVLSAGQAKANPAAYERAVHGTVWIQTPDGSGSGALVDVERKLIITNYHVVAGCDEVNVYFPRVDKDQIVAEKESYLATDGGGIRGRVVCQRRQQDLAIVELESLPEGARKLDLATHHPRPGDAIHSIGNPGVSDFLWVYSPGCVRQSGRQHIEFLGGQVVIARIIETSSPINPGDSGGPVFNDRGELVGVNSCVGESANLQSFCIDITEVRDLLASDLSQPDPNEPAKEKPITRKRPKGGAAKKNP